LVSTSNRHSDVNRYAASNFQNNVGLAVVLEALGRHLQGICTDIHIWEALESVSPCNRDVLYLGGNVGGRDRSILNDSASGVSDSTLDTAGSSKLGVPICGKQEDGNTEKNG
jgi:hypothetical protein